MLERKHRLLEKLYNECRLLAWTAKQAGISEAHVEKEFQAVLADVFWENHRYRHIPDPEETLYSLELREHTRMAYGVNARKGVA